MLRTLSKWGAGSVAGSPKQCCWLTDSHVDEWESGEGRGEANVGAHQGNREYVAIPAKWAWLQGSQASENRHQQGAKYT